MESGRDDHPGAKNRRFLAPYPLKGHDDFATGETLFLIAKGLRN